MIGLPDEDMGNRVHAIVEADPTARRRRAARASSRERLATYKLPRTVEVVDEPLRDDAGKVRRSALRSQRLRGVFVAWRRKHRTDVGRSGVADGSEAAPGEVGHEAGDLLGRLLRALVHPEAARALGQADEAVGELAALLGGEPLDVDEGGDGLGDGALHHGDLGGELLVAAGAAAEEHAEGGLVGLHEPEVGDEAELDLLVGRLGRGGGLGDGVEELVARRR